MAVADACEVERVCKDIGPLLASCAPEVRGIVLGNLMALFVAPIPKSD